MSDFLEFFWKSFFLFLCSIYSSRKILPRYSEIREKTIVIVFFFAFVVSTGTSLIHYYIPQASMIGMIVVSMVIYSRLLNIDANSAIIITVIGYGVSYLSYSLSAFILSALIFAYEKITRQSAGIFPYIAVGPIQLLFIVLLFRIRRFQRGIPILNHIRNDGIGVYLCITVLMGVFVLGLGNHAAMVIPVIICLLLMCGLVLFYWWKNRITQDYLTQLSQREKHDLQAEIDTLRKELITLQEDHDRLSRVVHKDNKLIPAMELAVSQLLYSIAQDDTQQSRMEQAQSILKQLKALSEERAGIVKNYEDASQKPPCLGLNGLDSLFLFMLQKAHMSEIEFDLKLDDGIDQIIPGSISESDASTLLADLIENALIAANHTEHKKAVQVKLGVDTGIFYISVSDSGPPFPPEVLERWGIERITTHADTGGSGIGMMTIYELCQKYSASFEIEQVQNMSPYRKCVSIRLDGQSAFRVH